MFANFLIAKYVPNIKRMEPRNIGVIVWMNGNTDSMFLGEAESGSSAPIPRRVGIEDRKNYRRWIASWRRQLGKTSLEVGRGETVPRESPSFLDGLREWSRGNYLLVEGGKIDRLSSSVDIRQLTNDLFLDLVAESESRVKIELESQYLKSQATALWKGLNYWERPDFRRDQPAFYELYGERKSFVFDYAVGPSERPYSVYHRMVLGNQRSFDSVFMNIEHYRQSRNLAKERCGVFVMQEPSDPDSQRHANLRILSQIATAIDIGDVHEAQGKLAQIAAMNGKP